MSQLRQIVKNSLEGKQVSPQILESIDTYIQRSVIRLQSQDLLPPRTLEFTSLDRKQEKRDGDDLVYNFYYLPDDFRKLDEFRPYSSYPYNYVEDEHDLYRDPTKEYTEADLKKINKRFTIVHRNQDTEAKSEKILVAFPFPLDTETIQIKYFVNGKDLEWDWIDEDYWEAVIMDVEKMVGLRSPQDMEAEEQLSSAVGRSKEFRGNNPDHRTGLKGSYFGKRRVRIPRSPRNLNNI